MEKHTNNYIEVCALPKKSMKQKIFTAIVVISVLAFGSHQALCALESAQKQYDYSVQDLNAQIEKLKLSRANKIKAERRLSKEKLENATRDENWSEINRLSEKIKNIDSVLDQQGEWELSWN